MGMRVIAQGLFGERLHRTVDVRRLLPQIRLDVRGHTFLIPPAS